MMAKKTADELLTMFYLDMRSALVETAATFDRIERAPGGERALEDERMVQLRAAAEVIRSPGSGPERARKILNALSVEDDA